MENPLVTIIITTYNRPKFLPIAIQSVINQLYTNWELIVVNDAGQDVKEIVDSFSDHRIVYILKEKNAGLGAARNTGIENAHGQYVCFLDDDDQIYPQHFLLLVKFMQENDYKIAYTDAVCHVLQKQNDSDDYIVTNRVIPYSIDYDPDMLLYQNITPVLCVMYELNEITQNIKLDENARVYEDYILWLELTKHYDMHHLAIPTCMYTFRQDGSTMSSSRNEFTTMLPGIYAETYKRAKDQVKVCNIMNQILVQRGLQPMFQIG